MIGYMHIHFVCIVNLYVHVTHKVTTVHLVFSGLIHIQGTKSMYK